MWTRCGWSPKRASSAPAPRGAHRRGDDGAGAGGPLASPAGTDGWVGARHPLALFSRVSTAPPLSKLGATDPTDLTRGA